MATQTTVATIVTISGATTLTAKVWRYAFLWVRPSTWYTTNRPEEWGRVSSDPDAMAISRCRISRFAPEAIKVGAIVSYKGDMLCCSTIAAEDVRRAIDAVGALRGAHALLCTPACAYYQDEAQPFLDLVRASYISNARAALADIAREKKVCKVAVYDDLGPEP